MVRYSIVGGLDCYSICHLIELETDMTNTNIDKNLQAARTTSVEDGAHAVNEFTMDIIHANCSNKPLDSSYDPFWGLFRG